jgi:hypothetical protein
MNDKFRKFGSRSSVARRLIDRVASSPVQYSYEEMQALPTTQIGRALIKAFGAKTFTGAAAETIWGGIAALDPQNAAAVEKVRLADFQTVSATGVDLSSHALQLAWAAKLLESTTGKSPAQAKEDPVFKAIVASRVAGSEIGRFASEIVANPAIDPKETVGWGVPGSWFWHNKTDQHINLDVFHSLAIGLEHSRVIAKHEIAHSEITLDFSPETRALVDEHNALVSKAKSGVITREEYGQLQKKHNEFQRRNAFFNTLEDVRIEARVRQDSVSSTQDYKYSQHLSYIAIGGLESVKHTHDVVGDAPDDFRNLLHTINLAQHAEAGLFESKPDKFQQFGAEPARIADQTTDVGSLSPSFEDLKRDVLTGDDSLATLLPSQALRYMPAAYREDIAEKGRQANELIDALWHRYVPKAPELPVSKHSRQDFKSLPEAPGVIPSQRLPGQRPAIEGEAPPPQQPSSSSQDAQGASQSQISEEQQLGEDAQPLVTGNPEHGSGAGQSSGQAENPDGQPGGSHDQLAEPDLDNTDFRIGSGEGDPDAPTIEVEGLGDLPGFNLLPATPQEDREAKHKEFSDAAPKRRISLADASEEFRQAVLKALREKLEEQSQAQEVETESESKPWENHVGRAGSGLDLAALVNGDWSQYRQRVAELKPIIRKVTADMEVVRNLQRKITHVANDPDIVPEDDAMARLDTDKYRAKQMKQLAGEKMQDLDFEIFRNDTATSQPAAIELFIMIDGSGSMTSELPSGITPMAISLQSSAIIYEAAKAAGIDTFIMMWGDSKARILARPGDKPQAVGDSLQRVRNGINSGTSLAPAVRDAVELAAKHKNNQGTISGSSHFLVIGDGEIQDLAEAARATSTLLRFGRSLSFDIAVVNPGGSQIEAMIQQVGPVRGLRIGSYRSTDPNQIPRGLAQLITRRLKQSVEAQTAPDSIKRRAFQQTLRRLDQQPS